MFVSVRRLTLSKLLVIPFVGQMLLVTGLVAYWSIEAGQQAVKKLAVELSEQTSAGVEQHLKHYLTDASRINEFSAAALSDGSIDAGDLDAIGQFLWKQAQLYDVGYFLFGRLDGNFVDVGRPATYDVEFVTERIDLQRNGNQLLHSYEPDAQGNPARLLEDPISYEFQAEAWYQQVLQFQQSGWTPIYPWHSPSANPLAISFASPVRDSEGNLVGAIAVEQRLSQISEFLRQVGQEAQASIFIAGRNGKMIATSGRSSTVKDAVQIQALDSSEPIIRETAEQLDAANLTWSNLKRSEKFEISVEEATYYVHLTPLTDELGLDWLTVVVIPKSNFLVQTHRWIKKAIVQSLMALAGSILCGLVIIKQLTRSIHRLNSSAQTAVAGTQGLLLEPESIHEIDLLRRSLSQLITQKQDSLQQLDQASAKIKQEFCNKIERLQRLNHQLHSLSMTDELTQLPNRRYFDRRIAELWQDNARESVAISVIMLDIDYFKQYNDCYGHPGGDRCLQQIAAILKSTVHRGADFVARYGGEEFVAILPATDAAGALRVAHLIQQAIAEARIPHQASNTSPYVTVSIGIGSLVPNRAEQDQNLLRMADEALYTAKRNGRNRIHFQPELAVYES